MPPVDLITEGFYADNDPTHSIVDPVKLRAYNESSGPVKQEGNIVVAAADEFRKSGSLSAARCVVQHMEAEARHRALTGKMSSQQAYYVQGWVLGAEALAFLKVRKAGVASKEQKSIIFPWLREVANQTRGFYDRKEKQNPALQNNHLYWAGVELGAVGIAANDQEDFDWSMKAAREGIAAIQADGTLPQEMRRGKRALHYHLYAAAPLVMLAELAAANGIDLYSAHESALKKLVKTSIAGLRDPIFFEEKTGIKQEVPNPPSGEAIGWVTPYLKRFPDPVIAQLLALCPDPRYMYLGGLPPGF
jgi:poly(beta-D-mannuronate) lyase